MEAYVFISLLGLGYLATKSSSSSSLSTKNAQKILKSSNAATFDESSTAFYDNSAYREQVRDQDEAKFKKRYSGSLHEGGHIISRNYRDMRAAAAAAAKGPRGNHESLLSGETIPMEEFTHNNMEPFFGSSVKQDTRESNGHEHLLERHTGVSKVDTSQEKSENMCFADITPKLNLDGYGTNDSYEEEYNRMVKSLKKTNELPFEKVQVGPGLNNKLQNGFQPDDREYAFEKSIDELRVATNPQKSYEGVIIPGIQGHKREALPTMAKNKVETFHERCADSWFKTTGAYKKDTYRTQPIIKPTHRSDSVHITGNIYRNIGNEQSSKLQPTHKKILSQFGQRNVNLEKNTKSDWDYGKHNILVFNNERDVTSTRTYEGNVISLIKSIVAPLQDAVKPTNKEFTLMNEKREFGEMQSGSTIPSKPTIYDPSDTTRTTIKETFIHDTRTGNLIPMKKNTVYDPEETMKTTLKETLPNYENVINMNTMLKKSTIYDPCDIAKTTIKETTEDNNHAGHVDTLEGEGAYQNIDMVAPNTGKQFVSDHEYMGTGPSKRNNDGYLTNEIQVDRTSKELLSDHDYFGMANSSDKKQQSYDDIYNATLNQAREILLKQRQPTKNNVKVTQGYDDISVLFKKNQCEGNEIGMQIHKVYDVPQSKEHIRMTTSKKQDLSSQENRIDASILDAFHQNPYTQPLTDSV
jgi:hypothetical protein